MPESEEARERIIEQLFRHWGAPEDQARTMASQFLKRARQVASEEDISVVEATEKLLRKVIEPREDA